MGEAEGLKYFRALAANGLQVRMGNALLTNLVIAGEVPFALTLYSYLPEQQKRAGAPVDWIALAPTIAATDAVGIAARAPHAKAAQQLYDFMLSEGQALMADMGHVVSTRRMAPSSSASSSRSSTRRPSSRITIAGRRSSRTASTTANDERPGKRNARSHRRRQADGRALPLLLATVLLAEELPGPDCPPVRVKVLGERLIAFAIPEDGSA